MKSSVFIFFLSTLFLFGPDAVGQTTVDNVSGVRKIQDVVIYRDDRFHSAFPSVIRKRNGDIIVAFRRAPDRKMFGEEKTGHVDANSYLVTVTSKDGMTWTGEPKLLYAHPFGGSQDPCLLQLRDGSVLCTSYGWAFVRPDGIANLKQPNVKINQGVVFLGGYLLRSTDRAKTWQGPFYPPHIAAELNFNALGDPLPAYNRGALSEGKKGQIFWAVAAHGSSGRTGVHLMVSVDKGINWAYISPIAVDEKITFNETSLYETPKGDLVAFLRSGGLGGEACIARSTDGGKTFQPWEQMGFEGYPLHALRLPDDRVLLTYGYRRAPFGIRARILNPECSNFQTAPEIILRDDGGSTDLGYPWAVQLDKKRVLVTYYFNIENGTRHIAGTILEIDGKR